MNRSTLDKFFPANGEQPWHLTPAPEPLAKGSNTNRLTPHPSPLPFGICLAGPQDRFLTVAAYSCPRVIHRSAESPQELLSAASVNNSAAKNCLGMNLNPLSHHWENTHRSATNYAARRWTPQQSPSSRAMRWSLTNTQRRTASISRSHYKPFAWISQRVF
jgi:hypothetical protein